MQREFLKTPSAYYKPAARQGTLHRIFYASKTYDEAAGMIDKDALVYLPYGYEEERIGRLEAIPWVLKQRGIYLQCFTTFF